MQVSEIAKTSSVSSPLLADLNLPVEPTLRRRLGRIAACLRNGASRSFAATAQGKEDHHYNNGNPCERDHEVSGGQR
jgi:hypothetical protein